MDTRLTPQAARDLLDQVVSKDLVDALDVLYPEKTPTPTDDITNIRHYGGIRYLCRFLRECAKAR